MRILVTGGGGFLGSYIVKELLKNPTYIVTNFSRHSYPHLEDLGVPTIKGDLTKREDVKRALSHGFDAIIHAAAKAGVWGSYDEYYSINFLGTKNLIDEALNAGIKKIVYTSSPSVVFGAEDIAQADESIPYPEKHLTAYAETKCLAEKIVLESNDGVNLLSVALRPHLIWGPGDPHLFPRLIQKGREGKLRIIGDGENLVDIIYVENAARAHVQALEKLQAGSDLCGKAYFLGQEKPVKLWDFINQVLGLAKVAPVMNSMDESTAYRLGWIFEKVFKLFGIKKPEPPLTRFVVLNLSKSHYFSHARAKKDFGYEPTISIEEGLRRTFKGV
jgi:2-alkyl-3-oxoalkanoate reductase